MVLKRASTSLITHSSQAKPLAEVVNGRLRDRLWGIECRQYSSKSPPWGARTSDIRLERRAQPLFEIGQMQDKLIRVIVRTHLKLRKLEATV